MRAVNILGRPQNYALKMLPEFDHQCISKVLAARQYATLRIIVLILQSYRTIQIEKIASILPVPIKYQSRRRHIQRFFLKDTLNATSASRFAYTIATANNQMYLVSHH